MSGRGARHTYCAAWCSGFRRMRDAHTNHGSPRDGRGRIAILSLAERRDVEQHAGSTRQRRAVARAVPHPGFARCTMAATRGLLVALLVLCASCAGSSTPEESVPKPVVDRNVISNEELQNPVLRGMDALRV